MSQIRTSQFKAPCDFIISHPLYNYSSFMSDEKKSMATFLGMEFDKQILLITEDSTVTQDNFQDYVANVDPNITLMFIPEKYVEEFLAEIEMEVSKWNTQQTNHFGYFDNGSLVFGMKKTKDGLIALMVDEAINHDLQDVPYITQVEKINVSNDEFDNQKLMYWTIEESNLYSYSKENFWENLKDDGIGEELVNFCKQQFTSQ